MGSYSEGASFERCQEEESKRGSRIGVPLLGEWKAKAKGEGGVGLVIRESWTFVPYFSESCQRRTTSWEKERLLFHLKWFQAEEGGCISRRKH